MIELLFALAIADAAPTWSPYSTAPTDGSCVVIRGAPDTDGFIVTYDDRSPYANYRWKVPAWPQPFSHGTVGGGWMTPPDPGKAEWRPCTPDEKDRSKPAA